MRGLTASGTQPSGSTGRLDVPAAQPTATAGPVTVEIPAPSNRFLRFVQPSGFFTIDYPDNWRTFPSAYAVSMAPERATLFTRSLLDGHVIYALSIAPARSFDALDRTFVRMMRTLVVNDDAVHRANRRRPLVGSR